MRSMRDVVLIPVLLLAVSCSPVVERPQGDPSHVVPPPPLEVPSAPAPPRTAVAGLPPCPPEPEPFQPAANPKVTSGVFSGIVFEGVVFDARGHRLRVIDQKGAPGARFADAAAAAASVEGLAAVNGGFFTPEGDPLGLAVSAGRRSGAWNSASSLGSGVWHADGSGRGVISRRESIGRARAASMREVLQAGPMLVENRRAVVGLDAGKSSARTLVLWDGGNRWWIGRTSPASLAQVAAAVAAAPVPGWVVRHALNLDGGRSSELWISGSVTGGPLVRRPPWNRPVRNFLVLVPRS